MILLSVLKEKGSFTKLIEYLINAEIFKIKILCRESKLHINRFLSHYIVDLARDKKCKSFFDINDEERSLVLFSTKEKSIGLLLEIFKLRPELKRLEIRANLDVNGMNRLFLEFNLGGRIEELCFRSFMWYDERSEVLG